jgi:hypothetical protein
MSVITITASYKGFCPFSETVIRPGDKIAKYTQEQHAALVKTISGVTITDLAEIICRAAHGDLIGKWGHEAVVNHLAEFSSTGRRISRPTTHERKFVPGSGFEGCDTYDRAYDNGVDYNPREYVSDADSEDEEFIAPEGEVSAEEDDDASEEETVSDWEEEEDDYWEEEEDEEEEEEEEDGQLHEPPASHDPMFDDVAVGSEIHSIGGTRWVWNDDNEEATDMGYRTVNLRDGRSLRALVENELVLDENDCVVGELYMDYGGAYHIHTGEGPCDG